VSTAGVLSSGAPRTRDGDRERRRGVRAGRRRYHPGHAVDGDGVARGRRRAARHAGPAHRTGNYSDGSHADLIASSAVIDSRGYGASLSSFLEGTVALLLPTSGSLSRIPNGSDTNDNSVDFAGTAVPTPAPRTTESPPPVGPSPLACQVD
jgi:hypothetical protein